MLELRQCYGCKEMKTLDAFPKSKRESGGRRYQCYLCKREQDKNRPSSRLLMREHRGRQQSRAVAILDDYRRTHPCPRCGESEPAALDFHHVDPSVKSGPIMVIAKNGTMQKLREELAKCIILCANCHRKFHAGLFSLDPSWLQTQGPEG